MSIIKQRDGIKVGDKVEYNGYNGYVAVIDPYVSPPFLLRLEEFNEDYKASNFWDENWYPESEKKEEHNCIWANKENFKVIEPQITNTIASREQYKRDVECFKLINQLINNTPTDMPEPCIAKGNKTMSNIKTFFNDLTVSAEDKELRKAGLKDSELNWTGDAIDIVTDLEAKERGYKNWEELSIKMSNNNSGGVTVLEAETLFNKFYDKLLENAKKFNKKEAKK